jgi:hypothetical protein
VPPGTSESGLPPTGRIVSRRPATSTTLVAALFGIYSTNFS